MKYLVGAANFRDKRKYFVVFYPRTGTTRKVAEAIKDALKCDIEEIFDIKKRADLFGYLRSVCFIRKMARGGI